MRLLRKKLILQPDNYLSDNMKLDLLTAISPELTADMIRTPKLLATIFDMR